jgi:hypothetical protein
MCPGTIAKNFFPRGSPNDKVLLQSAVFILVQLYRANTASCIAQNLKRAASDSRIFPAFAMGGGGELLRYGMTIAVRLTIQERYGSYPRAKPRQNHRAANDLKRTGEISGEAGKGD